VIQALIPSSKSDYFFEDPNNHSKELHVMNCEAFPKRKYPSDKFKLLGQITKVKVSDIVDIHKKTCENHMNLNENVIISIDGVSECKSSSRSLRILSLKFANCYEVYPCLIYRPEVFQKKRLTPYFNAHLEVYLEECIDEGLVPHNYNYNYKAWQNYEIQR
jgi:hypothetical protein